MGANNKPHEGATGIADKPRTGTPQSATRINDKVQKLDSVPFRTCYKGRHIGPHAVRARHRNH